MADPQEEKEVIRTMPCLRLVLGLLEEEDVEVAVLPRIGEYILQRRQNEDVLIKVVSVVHYGGSDRILVVGDKVASGARLDALAIARQVTVALPSAGLG